MYQPMNNQEKNTYVRSQILAALLKMMQEQPFANISISALVSRCTGGQGDLSIAILRIKRMCCGRRMTG